MNNNRDRQLDAVKGFAIILVIVGHVTAFSNPDNLKNNLLFTLIYSFHMHLFFFISGYLVVGRFGPTTGSWIKKKFMQLIIPYCVFTLFYTFVLFGFLNSTITPDSVIHVLFSYTIPDSAWFLPVLFESFVILALLILSEKVIGKSSFLIFFMGASFIIPLTPLDTIMAVHQIVVYTPFVILGYLVCTWKERLSPYVTIIEILGSILFVILFTVKSASLIPTINSAQFYLFYAYGLALTGIILSWSAIKLISNRTLAYPFIFCGFFTMEIYLTHLIILNYFTYLRLPLWIGSGAVAIISGTLVVLCLSIIGTLVLSYNKYMSTLIFGRWSYPIFKMFREVPFKNK
jgi:fucose 4-O-acetylase-like acetyltransferase